MINPVKFPVKAPASQQKCCETYINPKTNEADSKQSAFQAFEDIKQERYNDIFTHERAHQMAGGSQAGGITIETDANGVAIGGHVPIEMPSGVNKTNPNETLRRAETAYKSALAPGDPSTQDMAVASKALSIMSMARSENNSLNTGNDHGQNKDKSNGNGDPVKGKNLNYFA